MRAGSVDWNKAVTCGVFSGLLWGLLSLAVSSATRLFQAEGSIPHDLLTYLLGGAVYGLVLGGLMLAVESRFQAKKPLVNAVSISVSLWFLFFATGLLLHLSNPDRYHIEFYQHLQGLLLSLALGLVLGLLWGKYGRKEKGG